MRRFVFVVATVLSVPVLVSVAAGATFLVTPDSTGNYVNIQTAINSVAEGDTILLANGIYKGPGNTDLYVWQGVTILSQSGDPDLCIIDAAVTAKVFHYGFEFNTVIKGEATLEGVSIVGAIRATGAGITCMGTSPTIRNCKILDCFALEGAGIYVESGSPTITGCTIAGCDADIGAGIYLYMNSAPTIENCMIMENTVQLYYTSFPDLGFNRNGSGTATVGNLDEMMLSDDRQEVIAGGAGICCAETSSAVITGCEIRENVITMNMSKSDPGLTAYGAGISCQSGSDATITECIISHNRIEYVELDRRVADAAGGAGVYCSDCSPTVTDCNIIRNGVEPMQIVGSDTKAPFGAIVGGGVAVFYGAPVFTGCAIMGNVSAGIGGGVYVNLPQLGKSAPAPGPSFTGCTVCENAAEDFGGGFYIGPGDVPVTIYGCTISSNVAMTIGGIHYGYLPIKGAQPGELGDDSRLLGSLLLDHTILWGNCDFEGWGSEEGNFTYPVTFECCDVDISGVIAESPTWGTGNIFVNPKHCCPWDCRPQDLRVQPPMDRVMHAANYNLNVASPCLAYKNGGCGLIGSRDVGCRGNVRVCVDYIGPGFVGYTGQREALMGVEELDTFAGSAFELMPATPNPFNPSTELTFAIPAGSEPARVTMIVYNALGQKIRMLVDENNSGGLFRAVWDGRDDSGTEVASGVYFCHLRWKDEAATQRLVMLK